MCKSYPPKEAFGLPGKDNVRETPEKCPVVGCMLDHSPRPDQFLGKGEPIDDAQDAIDKYTNGQYAQEADIDSLKDLVATLDGLTRMTNVRETNEAVSESCRIIAKRVLAREKARDVILTVEVK